MNLSDPAGSSALSTGLGIASFGLGVAVLAPTATGVGGPADLALGALSPAANVGSLAARGASGSEIAGAAVLGTATLGFGAVGSALNVGRTAGTIAGGIYGGIEIAQSAAVG